MKIRKLTEKDRTAFKKLVRYAFSPIENGYEKLEEPKDDIPIDLFYGVFDNEKLMSGCLVIPYKIKLRGKTFKMGGISEVATKPEYRNLDAVKNMLQQIFQDLYKKGVPTSVLYPFKVSFYEKLGYYVAEEQVLHHFKITSIKTKKTKYFMKEVEDSFEDIKKVYNKITNFYDYIAIREEYHWKEILKKYYKFVCYNENKPVGYVIIQFPKRDTEWWKELTNIEETIYIREAFWLDNIAKQTIFNFLWSHRDHRNYVAGAFSVNENIIDMLDNPRILRRETYVNSLLRIVDVKKVLENLDYPINNFNLSIRIHDKQCPWNNGDFLLDLKNGEVGVKFVENKGGMVDLEINIGHLAQLLVGFRTIKDLLEFDLVTIKKDKYELLQKIFPKANNFFRDFF
ncbi:MAG: enhanced intracellular survival protein Eis [Candidatus Hodarchaeota archaeon]